MLNFMFNRLARVNALFLMNLIDDKSNTSLFNGDTEFTLKEFLDYIPYTTNHLIN